MSEVDKVVDDAEVEEDVQVLELTEEQLEALMSGLEDDGLEPIEKIDKKLFESRNIYLSGIIDEDIVNQIIPMIHYYNLDAKETGDDSSIKIYINSPGGEMTQGNAIVQEIENSALTVETIAQGTISSMGFVIFLAGDIRRLSRHTEIMYHTLSAGLSGTYSEMKNQMSYYERLQNQVDDYIVERTEIPKKKLKRYRERNLDWFLTFDECKKYKVFDEEI